MLAHFTTVQVANCQYFKNPCSSTRKRSHALRTSLSTYPQPPINPLHPSPPAFAPPLTQYSPPPQTLLAPPWPAHQPMRSLQFTNALSRRPPASPASHPPAARRKSPSRSISRHHMIQSKNLPLATPRSNPRFWILFLLHPHYQILPSPARKTYKFPSHFPYHNRRKPRQSLSTFSLNLSRSIEVTYAIYRLNLNTTSPLSIHR